MSSRSGPSSSIPCLAQSYPTSPVAWWQAVRRSVAAPPLQPSCLDCCPSRSSRVDQTASIAHRARQCIMRPRRPDESLSLCAEGPPRCLESTVARPTRRSYPRSQGRRSGVASPVASTNTRPPVAPGRPRESPPVPSCLFLASLLPSLGSRRDTLNDSTISHTKKVVTTACHRRRLPEPQSSRWPPHSRQTVAPFSRWHRRRRRRRPSTPRPRRP